MTLFIKIILLAVFLLLLNFLVTAPEANQLPGGSIGWSFGLTFLCILSEVAVGVAIFLERKNKHDQKKTPNTENETKSSVHDSKPHNLDPAMVNFSTSQGRLVFLLPFLDRKFKYTVCS